MPPSPADHYGAAPSTALTMSVPSLTRQTLVELREFNHWEHIAGL